MVIAYHLILTGYGHWLPNDPRGSLSRELRDVDLSALGDIHFGRRNQQPTRDQLKAFHRLAEQQLRYPVLWFETPDRTAIAEAIGDVIAKDTLTCYACAVLRNHVHLLVRRHRMSYEEMTLRLKNATADVFRVRNGTALTHPIWSADSCAIYKDTVRAVRTCVAYIEANPPKHRMGAQKWGFVTPYNDWPFHNRT